MSLDVSAKLFKFFPLLFFAQVLIAEDVVLITADRIKSSSEKTGNDVRVISEKEIQQSLANTLPDLLAKESDLVVASSGQFGSSASLFIRGTDSSHTLVLIDGIIMNDPGNPNRQFDIGKLSLNNIEKIEILKGSQGLAYGSNAIGGVVVITTKKAKSEEMHGEHYYSIGTFNTVNAGANFQKKINKLSTSFGADVFKTEGFSAADVKFNPGAEKDGAQRITLDLNSSYDFSEEYDASVTLRYNHNDADIDKGGGPGADDPNDKLVEEELFSRLQIKKTWESGKAETKFGFNHSSHKRNFEVNTDSVHPELSRVHSKGDLNEINLEHVYFLTENLTQNINLSFQHEDDQLNHFNENLSAFIYHQYETQKAVFNFGLRTDHNKIFNEHLTYKAAAGYKINESLLKLSYSTGFRAPSINQLYTPVYGNKNLVPETSRSTELSFDSRLSESLQSQSSLFYTKINDRFSYDPVTFFNINRGAAEISGFEQTLRKMWLPDFYHHLSFTLLKTRDLARGEKLARRPDINVRNNFYYTLKERHELNYELAFTGQRTDVDNNGISVKANAYLLSNISYLYKLNEKNEFFLKVKNLFNKDYEEIYGFGTGGRALSIGAHFYF
jgi:vitamin B12 transporter